MKWVWTTTVPVMTPIGWVNELREDFAYNREVMRTLRKADRSVGRQLGPIRRVLTHEESKLKAQAAVLREMADMFDKEGFGKTVWQVCANNLRRRADELWPLRGKKS